VNERIKKILLVTFSTISDHQDKVVVMYEELKDKHNVYTMVSIDLQVPLEKSYRTWLVKCPKRPGICKGTFNLFELLSIIRRVRKERFDVLFFETLHIWNLPLLLLVGKKTKTIQMIHDVIPHEGDRGAKLVDLMNRVVCILSDEIAICNKKYIKSLCERYSVAEEKVKNINLWERFPNYAKPKRTRNALFFGRLNPYKGADNLLEIVKRCPEIQFDIVGKPDPQVLKTIEELKRQKNVHIDSQYITDDSIPNVFGNADWIILPYNSATQSGVVVESYKNSRPVISFNVGALSEQIEDGVSGYLVKPKDISMFVDVLRNAMLLKDDDYFRFCENAYYYGASKYSASKLATEFLDLILLPSVK